MTQAQLIYIVPYLISLGLSLGVFFYAFNHRNAKGAKEYNWLIGIQIIWMFAFAFETVSLTLPAKLFWNTVQWLMGGSGLVVLPMFVIRYTEQEYFDTRRMFQALCLVPGIFCALLLTNPLHFLVYPDPHLVETSPFQRLNYTFTPILYGYALYGLFIAVWILSLLVKRFFQPHGLYRKQVAVISLGIFFPLIGIFLDVVRIQHDSAPLFSAIGNTIVAWGMTRYRIFQVTPVARDKVFEAMVDPVVILDNQNRVADINSAMLALLGKDAKDVIGESAKEVFADFPIPIRRYTQVSYAREEATFEIQGKHIYYEMTVWPLFDSKKQMAGRIYISHDITALKELERELRELTVDLEKRVRARTNELAEAYDITLEGWAKALELRDKETEGHSRRVTETTVAVARAMDISDEDIEHIRRGAILHDIGKMGIPDQILHKEGPLTDEEKLVVMKHPQTAYDLLSQIPFLERALDIPYCHHEKWDGSGYPRGLKARGIPMPARIFAVADVWDALTSDRPYRKAWSREKTIQYLIDETGKHFDPRVVNAFLGLMEKGEI